MSVAVMADVSGAEDGLCEYGKKALKNIGRNNEMMLDLDLPVLEVGPTPTIFPDKQVEAIVRGCVVGKKRQRATSKRAAANCEEEALCCDEDEYLYCDDCDKKYHGDCPVHGPLSGLDLTAGYDQASITYTQLPVPAQLTVRPSGIPGAGLGIFAVSLINKGIRVGPYEGRKVSQENVGDIQNMAYTWQVKHNGINAYLIDGHDTSNSNWMRFVNCAQREDEQNVLAYQYHGNIYYHTVKTIYPESELLVWYEEKVAKELDMDLETEASPANFYCRGCGGSFSEERSFCIHLKHSSKCGMAHPQTFTCLICHQQFTQLEFLQQHIRKHGNLVQGKQCSYCEKSFSSHGSLQAHLRTHTGDKPYKCEHCGKFFCKNSGLQSHIRTHTGDKPYKCKHCGKFFRTCSVLQTHVRTHTGDKPYKCELCGKSFSACSGLQRHVRTHTGDKPYKCEHCGIGFSQHWNLKSHLGTHTGDKPYKCGHCGKCFRTNRGLQTHIRTHTGDKPYKCEHCGKFFRTCSAMRTHARTHTGDKPYKCEHCGKKFRTCTILQRHVRTHTGDKPYKCEHCGKGFGQHWNLKVHLRTHTGDKP